MPNFPNTPEQDAIVSAWTSSKKSLMINALAGTGKTSTLTILSSAMEASPRKYETLVLVFNKKNAEEMKGKLPARFDVMTLNSLGFRALNRYMNRRLQVDQYKDSDILKKIVGSEKLPDGIWQDVMSMVSLAKTSGLIPLEYHSELKSLLPDDFETWESLAESKWIELIPEVHTLAHETLVQSILKTKEEGVVDFDDMIYLSVAGWGAYKRYPVVMVDEAQDLSPLNHLQIKKALEFQGRYVIVGDPRQAIYAFRGADTKSMGKIRDLKPEQDWTDLTLSVTFRCPKAVVARARNHVPNYVAFESNPEGEVKKWIGTAWGTDTLPEGKVAILCRNNAPLLSCAFRLIAAGYGVQMLGRDIGKNLVRLLEKIAGKGNRPLAEVVSRVKEWEEAEVRKLNAMGKEKLCDGVYDRSGCLFAVAEFEKVSDLTSMKAAIVDLFESNNGRFILGTGHRAKGLEWPTVVHLDPWRIPSKFAQRAEDKGDPGPMEQEKNLRYVLETRAQRTLILANLEDFQP